MASNSYCTGTISQGITIDCDNLLVPGIEQRGIIINRKDVDFDTLTYDASNKNIVTNLVLKGSAVGYEVIIPTQQPFNGTGTTLGDGTVRRTFTNTLGMVILANDPSVSANVIDGLANGEFVVIFENKYKNLEGTASTANKGSSTFQIMGLLQGLTATTLENDKYSTDTEGGWNVVLTETSVPKSALFFFNTNIADTRAAFEALLG